MNRPFANLGLAALLLACLLTGCSKEQPAPSLTPAERTQLYQSAIESARDQEINDAFALITSPDDQLADVVIPLLGVKTEDMTAYALSASPMITQAYAVAAIYPEPGREDAVLEGLNGFIDQQKQNFQQYLADQYDIASNARLETLSDGTILLVMCSQQDAVFDAIRDTIESGEKA